MEQLIGQKERLERCQDCGIIYFAKWPCPACQQKQAKQLQKRIETFEETSIADANLINQWAAKHDQLQAENEKLEGNYEKLANWFNRHYIATCNDAYCVKDDCGECTDATHALAKILALDGKGGEE